jgi:hypothetical protein
MGVREETRMAPGVKWRVVGGVYGVMYQGKVVLWKVHWQLFMILLLKRGCSRVAADVDIYMY